MCFSCDPANSQTSGMDADDMNNSIPAFHGLFDMDAEIVLNTHPTGNHPDVAKGSFDVEDNNDPRPGSRVDVEETVCNMLIARDGKAYYADDYGHVHCAIALGFDDTYSAVEEAMKAGYVHVAVTYEDISFYVPLTESQKRTLHEAYFTAISSDSKRCRNYVAAFTRIARQEGIEI